MTRVSLRKREKACKTRPVLRRCRWMAEMLRERGKLPSCEKLGQEFEVSYKTIARDIDLMRDFMGYPIQYDRPTYTWKLAGPLPEPVL